MKLQIFLLIALFTIAIAEPSCDLDSMCMGCDATTADKCTHCYNGVVATYGARALVSNACSTKLTPITDCEVYRNDLSAAAAATVAGNYPCWKCASGKDMIMTPTTTGDYQTSELISSDTWTSTFAGTASCGTKDSTASTGGTDLTNCTNVVTISTGQASGADIPDGRYCLMTASGYGFDTSDADGAYKNAVNASGDVAAGCDNYIMGAGETSAYKCHNPTSGHAISSTGIIGVAFTTDTNCRQLSTGDLVCGVCTDAYWFGGSTCYLSAKMLVLSAGAFLLAMLM